MNPLFANLVYAHSSTMDEKHISEYKSEFNASFLEHCVKLRMMSIHAQEVLKDDSPSDDFMEPIIYDLSNEIISSILLLNKTNLPEEQLYSLIPTLINILKFPYGDESNIIISILHKVKHVYRIMEKSVACGCIPYLLDIAINARKRSVANDACHILQYFTFLNSENIITCVNTGVVPELISIIAKTKHSCTRGNPCSKMQRALVLLRYFTKGNDYCKMICIKNGIIPEMVSLIRLFSKDKDDDNNVCSEAAWALYNLSENPSIAKMIVPFVFPLLSSNKNSELKTALAIFKHILKTDETKLYCIKHNLVEKVLSIIRFKKYKVCVNSLRILYLMSNIPECKHKLHYINGAIRILTEHSRSTDIKIKTFSESILSKLH